jgi:hypothetical protein
MKSGYILGYNGKDNTNCYKAGVDSTTGLELGPMYSPAEGGKILSFNWYLPCSENGVTVTGFETVIATDNTKPRPDAVKTVTIQEPNPGGPYKTFLVPDDYTLATLIADFCAGCEPLPAVTIPEPIIFYAECTKAAPVIPDCVYKGAINIPALTGSNNTWTATAYGYDKDGVAIVFAPTTATGTSVSLLAAAMQTAWASELGTGTFTATGNTIAFASTNGAKVGFVITQSEV